MYYHLFKDLVKHYCVIAFDLIGMGGSSRPDNYKHHSFKPQDSIDYFNLFIELWRQALNLKEFYLVAHSLGGYIGANYAYKYP